MKLLYFYIKECSVLPHSDTRYPSAFSIKCSGRASCCAAWFMIYMRTDRCVTRLVWLSLATMHSPQRNRKEWLCNICVGFYWPYGGGTFISAIIIGASLYPFFSRVFIYYALYSSKWHRYLDHFARIRWPLISSCLL